MKTIGTLAALLFAIFLPIDAASATSAAVTPGASAPGGLLTLTGAGFDASTVIDVYLDTADVGLLVSTATGAVSAPINVPASAQPGTHWLTLIERKTQAAAQVAFRVGINWPQTGFGPSKRNFNPYENTINTGNVAQLVPLWSRPLDGFGNSKPMIAAGNILFLRDANQVVRAISATGTLLWTATTPFSSFPDALTPVAAVGTVFFSDLNGNVIAYKLTCRSDGGVCAPTWTVNIGSGVAGGLTYYKGSLYVPAADGLVHVLNPTTGAPGTSISVTPGTALTSWIAFGVAGDGYVASGSAMYTTSNGSFSSSGSYGGTLSSPAVGASTAYVTAGDNNLREVNFGWTTALAGSGCYLSTPPALANGVVYAAGCASIGAYEAGKGSTLWTVPTSGSTQGLTYANGVLYACVANRVVAYAASYGGKLWTGGYCSAAPIVVSGVLYVSYADLEAYTLTAAQSTGSVSAGPPDPKTLHPGP